jgi:hypothetical protein
VHSSKNEGVASAKLVDHFIAYYELTDPNRIGKMRENVFMAQQLASVAVAQARRA